MATLRRSLRPLAVLATMFLVLGTPYGIEEIVPASGPALSILVLVAMAVLWAAPYALLVAELVSAMPAEGGIYHWFRVGFGPGGLPVLVVLALVPSAIAIYVLFTIGWDNVAVGATLIALGPVLYLAMQAWRRLAPAAFVS